MKIRPFLNYLRQIALWIWRGKYHILTFSAVMITILYLARVLNYYPNILSAFMAITGLLIILTQQILDAREFADHRPHTIRSWIKSFPTRKPIVLSVEGAASVFASGKAHVTVSISKDATIENKVDFLLRQVDNLQTAIGIIDDRIDDVASSLANKSKELKINLDKLNASLKTTIAGHIVGAYDINLFGIIIAICGILIQLFYS
jgi:hypothetical protein